MCSGFLGSKAVQDSLGRPDKAPRRHLNSSKPWTKNNCTQLLLIVGIWEHFWASFLDQKVAQNRIQQVAKNGTSFGTACSASHRSETRQNQVFARLSGRYWVAGNTPSKRQGGIEEASKLLLNVLWNICSKAFEMSLNSLRNALSKPLKAL